jgi:radical SAM superfamily enzyme YgiQ (UPF0313 family)
MKKNVYFNEYNLLMGSGGVSYLPLVSGILAANAKKNFILKKNFKFKPFIFKPDTSENIIKNYYDETPDIALFSISMWNEQLSLEVAEKLKKQFNTFIIFGGPSCPHIPIEYFKKYKFIDVAVRAEGEDAFNAILTKYLSNNGYDGIPNVAYREKNGDCKINYQKVNFSKDLDVYPSPYLTGEFDYLFKKNEDHSYQVIIETNRGCPFLCTYCYWGKGGNTTKYRFHSLERVFAEIDWIAKNKIKYVFNADSNFGMHRRDIEIAKKLVDTKKKYKFPEKFRTCWGKNSSEQIFKVAELLNLHDLEKGITLARQTNSKKALKNVKRDNIKLEAYSDLEKKFNHLQIPVYAEMILGLPGETYKSWINGLSSLVDTSINNQIFVYQAEVYPNTEMNEKNYREKHGIKTKRISLNEIHCSPREQKWIKEYQEIVVATKTMTEKQWQKSNVFSVVMMVLHSFKTAFYLIYFLIDYYKIKSEKFFNFFINNCNKKNTPFIYENLILTVLNWTEDLLAGKGRGIFDDKYSDVYLDIEEVSYLKISENFDKFYSEIKLILKTFLGEKKFKKNEILIQEIIEYQKLRMSFYGQVNRGFNFKYNIPEYFFKINSSKPVNIKKKNMKVFTVNIDNHESLQDFTKKKIIWARKSDKIKNDLDYEIDLLDKIKEDKLKLLKQKNVSSIDKNYKIPLFDKQNKFKKFDSINLKNNRRI